MGQVHSLQHAAMDYPFMTCIIKVNGRSSGQRTVAKVLKKRRGIYNFRMNNGAVEVSGTVDPQLLLKVLGRAGRKAELLWLQFGECSNNLFMPMDPSYSYPYPYDGRYLHPTGTLIHRPKLPSHDHQQISYNYADKQYDYGQHNSYQLSYGGNHGYYQNYDYQQAYDNYQRTYDYSQAENQGSDYNHQYSGGDQGIVCCTVM